MAKKLYKSKTQMVIYTLIFIICIGLFIYIGQIDYTQKYDTDAEKFANLYDNIPEDNLYVFADAVDILSIVSNKSGVILMGFPTNKWTGYYAKILNEVAEEVGIDKIYYYDFLQDREENNGSYETILNKLKVYAPVSDEGNMDVHAPTVIIVKNGEIIGYFDDTSIMKGTVTPEIYYTENQIALTKNGFKTALKAYIK